MPNNATPQKQNFQRILDAKLDEISRESETPHLLLHACCAPCSSYVLEYLTSYFRISIDFYNPNITDHDEYEKRRGELARLISEMPLSNPVTLLDFSGYDPDAFQRCARGNESAPERGARCQACISLRLAHTLSLAREIHADFVTTTLTISPHKDADFINATGARLAEKFGTVWLFSDFKKRGGYARSIVLSREYHLYRQNFCGCEFSRAAAEARRKEN